VTPGVAGALILATDFAFPNGSGHRVFTQDAALYASGVAATSGITDFFKGWFARPRPLTHLAPELAAADTSHSPAYHRSSFFSGHTSAAFYSMTFLVRHTRETMRREMSADAFDRWGWVPGVLGYGWATYVGFSRIQAQRHYLTDVVVGAAAGVLMGTLYHALSNDIRDSEEDRAGSAPFVLSYSWSF
jgi:membrane-associated phospholipid phosphatase